MSERSSFVRATLVSSVFTLLAFGLVEQLLNWHVPLLWGDDRGWGWGPWWVASLALFILVVIGFFVGLADGPLLKRVFAGPRPFAGLAEVGLHALSARATAALTLAVVCLFALLSVPARPGGKALMLLAGAVAVVGAVAVSRERVASWFGFLLRTPTLVALLFLPGWLPIVLFDRPSGLQSNLAPILAGIAIAFVGWLVHMRIGELRPHSGRSLVALLSASVALVFCGWLRLDGLDDLAGTARAARSDAKGPNVVLIVLDTVRADHLSLYGYERPTTPRLEQLAESSVVFESAIAPGDMTLSSHASLFTGLYAVSHGAHFDADGAGQPLPPTHDTLAEHLREAGWTTLGLAANHVFFGRGFGLEQGFEAFDARPPTAYRMLHEGARWPWFGPTRALHRYVARELGPESLQRHYRSAECMVDGALAAVDAAQEGGAPFFLFLNLMDAHFPYVPPAPYDGMFPGKDARFEDPAWRHGLVDAVVRRGERGVTEAERAHMQSQYDGAIAYMDAQLGRLVDHLEASGVLDDTLLVVTSDHGEAFGEHGLVGHAVSVHQHQVHVPLLIRKPGARRAERLGSASLRDVPATVLRALGMEDDASFPGQALLPEPLGAPSANGMVQPGSRPQDRQQLAESYPNPALGGERLRRVERAFFHNGEKLWLRGREPEALFDLVQDPAELSELDDEGARLAELTQLFEAWMASQPAARESSSLDDAATLERLRNLGY